ncbi:MULTISPECIES: NUDIX hydrolase [Pseudonocardia]|uniref:8-oxo-dGTP pyrophosphatase MutT (NUDIX family) n=1 Tax=Pseudonocardia alni TaxID=33907 RepID=A0A852VUU2_PSEA5|nr:MULTISPECIES: NUDIX domain-containing protein [Pseudonocardia]MBO4239654.1 NUDIX domain-containing protein [Pseudonocardia alni]MCO7194396.1 NUDIX domain-containing protein [Pseudonocardia sp. McavD-2-B]NYF99778.1 8-oxo-dGTP pyrophosphatase MutT (NUDIX family) [Pseudonocardia antarctica]
MTDPARERLTVFDAGGAPTGVAERGEVYARSLWHATTAVLLRSADGTRVYVHRRTDTKLVMAGMWDCLAGGVLDEGETPDACAARELGEELGVTGVPLEKLAVVAFDAAALGVDTGPGTGPDGLRAHVHVYRAFSDGPVTHQPSEVAEGGWWTLDELAARIGAPDRAWVPDGLYVTRLLLADLVR